MIYVKQVNDIYEIKFRYDPEVIEIIKRVPGRAWDPDKKVWSIPKSRLGFMLNEFRGTDYENSFEIDSEEEINQNSTLDTTQVIPDIDISRIPYYVKEGSKPYQHQLDFMKFAINRQLCGNMEGFILADDPGLGKTNESINLALYNRKQYRWKHCLVICCVNSSKYNWKEDIEDHTRGAEEGYILGTRLKRNGSENYNVSAEAKYDDLVNLTKYGDPEGDKLPYFLIMNIESLRYKEKKSWKMTNQIVELINQGEINMIIIDEVHKNTSQSSKQGQQISNIYKQAKKKIMWLPMSGTPIVNKPTDVFLPLRLVGGHNFTSFYTWQENFCIFGGFGGHDIIGYKNIPYLKSLLQNNMLRRLKGEVLDLPPEIEYTEYVENTDYQKRLYAKTQVEVKKQIDNIQNKNHNGVMFIRLRQVCGSPEIIDPSLKVDDNYVKYNAKLKRLLELIDEAVERDEKVVVFSNWVEPLRTLYKFVSKRYKTCCFTGTMSEEDRQQHKRVFQNNPEYKVLLGTIGAAGTTHTFTAASTVIFYDEPWTATDKRQASDRCYRIGTTKSVKVYTLITQDTVDDIVHAIVYRKKGVSTYIVDNKLDFNNTSIVNLILGGQQ